MCSLVTVRCRGGKERALATSSRHFAGDAGSALRESFIRTIVIATAAIFLSTAAFAANQAEKRIARGFIHLGMGTRKAACYGAVIGGRLKGQDLAQAAKIVESAKNSDDVRKAVTAAGLSTIDAFSAAHNRCK